MHNKDTKLFPAFLSKLPFCFLLTNIIRDIIAQKLPLAPLV